MDENIRNAAQLAEKNAQLAKENAQLKFDKEYLEIRHESDRTTKAVLAICIWGGLMIGIIVGAAAQANEEERKRRLGGGNACLPEGGRLVYMKDMSM